MINVLISEPYVSFVSEDILVRAAQATLAHQEAGENVEMTVVIDTDEQLRELNKQFLNIDAPTDVLSFPSDEVDPDSNLEYIGDVIISYPRAKEQADTVGETVLDEIQLLVIHGTLHLLGHDHAEPAEKDEMWTATREILAAISCPITHYPE
jgi:probable rRNA maturation factor